MIFNSLFFQILLAGLGVAIGFVYIQPAFERIGEVQDATAKYKFERERVSEVNTKLASLVGQVNAIPKADQAALLVYMPDKVDSVAVSRDLYNLSLMSRVNMVAVNYKDNENTTTITAPVDGSHRTMPIPHTFGVSITGSYDDIKEYLMLLEQSNYPLEVHKLDITSEPEAEPEKETKIVSTKDELSAYLEVVTYSRI
ncbi:MAG: hypothetical protein H6779_04015 [Candidatus Nomurabacteria bacterium]|nr:MAG: hypothetical protein H6779_04015 [Candidatus Nomurabacteria bacterium]